MLLEANGQEKIVKTKAATRMCTARTVSVEVIEVDVFGSDEKHEERARLISAETRISV